MGESRKMREAKKNNGKEEEKKKEEDADMDVDEEKDEAKMEEEPTTVVELTEEEKTLWYRKSANPDIEQSVLAKSYASFTLPTKEEGFDEVTYVWQTKDKC